MYLYVDFMVFWLTPSFLKILQAHKIFFSTRLAKIPAAFSMLSGEFSVSFSFSGSRVRDKGADGACALIERGFDGAFALLMEGARTPQKGI